MVIQPAPAGRYDVAATERPIASVPPDIIIFTDTRHRVLVPNLGREYDLRQPVRLFAINKVGQEKP